MIKYTFYYFREEELEGEMKAKNEEYKGTVTQMNKEIKEFKLKEQELLKLKSDEKVLKIFYFLNSLYRLKNHFTKETRPRRQLHI